MKTVLRAGVLVGAVAIGLTGCSSGSETLRLIPSGAAGNEAAMDASKSWGAVTYEVAGDLPEMPSEFVAYTFDKQDAPLEQAEAIAKVLGLEGEMVVDTNAGDTYEEISSYRIGDNDYTKPGMWLNGNGAEWWWNYYPGDGVYGDAAISSRVSEPCPPEETPCEIDVPEPPENLPSKNEVEKLTTDLLVEFGVDVSIIDIQVYVDEWSATSYATQRVNEIESPISWSFSFGENSVVLSASGVIANVSQDGTFPLTDPTEAVNRLDDYRYYGWGRGVSSDLAMASSSYMDTTSVMTDSGSNSTDNESSSGTGDTTDDKEEPVSSDEPVAIDEPLPADDTPVVTEEPEPVVIEITSVRMLYVASRTADGRDVLLPAFMYSNNDGDVGAVIALSDDVFQFDDEETPGTDGDTPEPAPEPGVDPGMSEPIPVEKANELVGLTEDEAMATAAESGWEFRVSQRDGESYMLTTDYVTNRVNVVIEDGLITEVTVG